MPSTPGNVLRSLSVRHPEETKGEEIEKLASIIDRGLKAPVTAASLQEFNGAWARGNHLCNLFSTDKDALSLP